jgi:hypothetical protein
MMASGVVILLSIVLVRFTKTRFWAGWPGQRGRYFDVQPPSTGSVTPVT